MRPPHLRRSLIFVAGADAAAQEAAVTARPDVLVQDLEDFTPPQLKDAARRACAGLLERCRATGIVPGVRINRLDDGGLDDLDAILTAHPALVMLPKAETGEQIAALAVALDARGADAGIEIVPTAETARGVADIRLVAAASARVTSAVLGAEDLAADLLAERTPEAGELAHARRRFILECRAARIEPIDAPFTYADAAGCQREAQQSRQLGYRCKSTVTASHVAILHRVLTPGIEEIARARAIVAAFEAARAKGEDRPLVDGLYVEPPAYHTARRLLDRAAELARFTTT